ncbi:hypothetical protein FIBSPDRAFT_955275 [Athelia psychrophila]|uniref:Methyltransferase n=1 Tax=Athelia psychrophila TaxID=1759441 RepID=A0A166IAD7_9AGAM|nr:hypothetical protein FIBSPDRAFT_955275 [Fibularhizoctonia sp. CBS 109695]
MSSTTANLLYFTPPANGERPFFNIFSDPTAGQRSNSGEEVHPVEIENLRGKEDSVSLDTAGFQFFKRAATHTEFMNAEDVEKEYYPESIELMKELTGASRVVLFNHTIRRRRLGESEDTPGKRQPVANVHVDLTPAAAIARVHRHLPPAEVEALLTRRFQIINLWRPISHAALDWPLALCDYRSVDVKKDLHTVTLRYPDREGELFGVAYNPDHRWKYLRGMETDEFVLLKCFDSIQDGSVAVMTPHTGFQDPSTPDNAPLRESIELNALVFYD